MELFWFHNCEYNLFSSLCGPDPPLKRIWDLIIFLHLGPDPPVYENLVLQNDSYYFVNDEIVLSISCETNYIHVCKPDPHPGGEILFQSI